MIGNLTVPQEILHDLICMISDERYCSGWYRGIEVTLWRELMKAQRGEAPMTQELEKLLFMSQSINGWITWKPGAPDPEYIRADKWIKILKDAKKQAKP